MASSSTGANLVRTGICGFSSGTRPYLLLSYAIFELGRAINYSIVYPVRIYVLRDTDLSMDVLILITHAIWALSGYGIGAASAYFVPKFAVRATLGAAFLILLSSFKYAWIGNIVLFVIVPLLAGCFRMHCKRQAQAPLFNKTA